MQILKSIAKLWHRASPNYRRDRARTLQNKLDDFVSAQDLVYPQVTQELAAGRKATHWIWYIFPQLSGMGTSAKSIQYGLNGWPEAKAYWDNYLLRYRLRECIHSLLNNPPTSSIETMLGDIDSLKFQSCLTLFMAVAPRDRLLNEALVRFYNGTLDNITLTKLGWRGTRLKIWLQLLKQLG